MSKHADEKHKHTGSIITRPHRHRNRTGAPRLIDERNLPASVL